MSQTQAHTYTTRTKVTDTGTWEGKNKHAHMGMQTQGDTEEIHAQTLTELVQGLTGDAMLCMLQGGWSLEK